MHKASLIWRSYINISFLVCVIVWLLLTRYKYFLRAILTLDQVDALCSSNKGDTERVTDGYQIG